MYVTDKRNIATRMYGCTLVKKTDYENQGFFWLPIGHICISKKEILIFRIRKSVFSFGNSCNFEIGYNAILDFNDLLFDLTRISLEFNLRVLY